MIIQLNRYGTFKKGDEREMNVITHDKYPKQDKDKVGKLIRLRWVDHILPNIINNRDIIFSGYHPKFTGTNDGLVTYFLILRYDSEYPYKVILMNDEGKVIVTDNYTVAKISVYEGYKSKINESTNSSEYTLWGGKEEYIPQEVDRDTYDEMVCTERIHFYPPQDNSLLGLKVYTEYWRDIIDHHHEDNQLEGSPKKSFKEIKEELLKTHSELDNDFPNELLKSYRLFHDNHGLDLLDSPRMVLGNGIIIRADEEFGQLTIAEKTNNGYRYVTGDEGFFYIDSKDLYKPIMKQKEFYKL